MTIDKKNTDHIIQILEGIDQRIVELNNASNQDFNHLHYNFKELHHESIVIISNIKKAQYILKGTHSKAIQEHLEKGYEQCRDYHSKQEGMLESIMQIMETILFKFDQIYIPLYNFKQNLLTLKLILSNKDLKNRHLPGKNDQGSGIEQMLQEFQQIYHDIEHAIHEIKGDINDAYGCIENYKSAHSLRQYQYHLHKKSKHALFDDKASLSLTKEFGIEDITKLGYENIEEIITNLQYHDIIRQKIEHIQQTHSELIKEIANIDTSQSSEDYEKFFSTIRYIAELQSAQLIHTNKKYQTAIKIIVDELLNLGKKIASVNKHLESFFSFNQTGPDSLVKELSQPLVQCLQNAKEWETARQEFMDKTKGIYERIQQLQFKCHEIEGLKRGIQEAFMGKSAESGKNPNALGIHDQMETIFNEVQSVNAVIQQLLHDSVSLSSDLHQQATLFGTSGQWIEPVDGHAGRIEENLDEFQNELSRVLSDNQELTGKINTHIHSLVKDVKYYDFFEKKVDKIILDFHELVRNQHSMDSNREHSIKDLEKIKHRYTMKSEHEIHENLAKLNFNFQEDTSADEEEDPGELELF